MSKLAIVLCAVLFASVVQVATQYVDLVINATIYHIGDRSKDAPEDSQGAKENLSNMTKKFDDMNKNETTIVIKRFVQEAIQRKVLVVNATIDGIQERHKYMLGAIRKINEGLSNMTKKFDDENKNKTAIVIKRANDEIKKLTDKVKDVNITECRQFQGNLSTAFTTASEDTKNCTASVRDTVFKNFEPIANVFDNTLANLTKIREEVRHCGDDVQNLNSTDAATLCVKMAGDKAIGYSSSYYHKMDDLRNNVTMLTYENVMSSLNNCSKDSGLTNLYHNWTTYVNRTEECINKIIEQTNITHDLE